MNFRIEEIKARLAEIEKERGLLLKELDYLSAADSSLPALLGVPSCQNRRSLLESVSLFSENFFAVATISFPSCGKTGKKGQRATLQPAMLNGYRVFVANPVSSARNARTVRTRLSINLWPLTTFRAQLLSEPTPFVKTTHAYL
jgi:hypothetical protein